jgi:type II secretory ATPase GspE/PulE/Tfp pilus assembly ATPase PilB-like protein
MERFTIRTGDAAMRRRGDAAREGTRRLAPSPPPPLAPSLARWFMAPALLLAAAGPALADEAVFPRGPGFYFSLPRLGLVVIIYLCWLRTCWWVDQDSRETRMPTVMWNTILLCSGVAGLILVWLSWMPVLFWLMLPVLLLCWVVPTAVYANIRNKKVPEERRVFTRRHLHELFLYYTGQQKKEGDKEDKGPPVQFIAKSSTQTGDDPARVARAAASKGYKAARAMVYDAIQSRATDIHMEPTKEEMTVRFRVDGILQPTAPFSRAMGDAVINIFKVLGDMNITEKRKPQDGSFSAEVEERGVDFRVATAGSVMGEKLVLRILDKSQQIINVTQLGMRERMHQQIHEIVRQPHGMFIVSGPTGAGKSTTLYACLNEIDRYQTNVITIENPVEYQMSNVTQIEVNPKAGKTFASELRSILRQDPDVILIGEIRDQETAEIACQAAQTGHMVFTTLHANDTVTALARLIDLGVAPFLIASAVSAVLGQRLVRVLCPKCKVRYKPAADLVRKANLPLDKVKFFYRPPELEELRQAAAQKKKRSSDEDDDEALICKRCGGTGYLGRTGIFELMVVTDKIRELLKENPNLNAIRQEAVKNGMVYLQQDGLRQVIEGKTSIQEILRVSK